MNTDTPLPIQVRAIANLKAFAEKSAIPYRTLIRIKSASDDYKISGSTKAALELALKKFKPKARES